MKPKALDEARSRMVQEQIDRRGLHNQRLLDAFLKVPRHLFVPEEAIEYAYNDEPLPISCGQTISQPYIVALMTSLLDLHGGENVLEIGAGSGYQAAILAEMTKTVHSVEYHAALAEGAQKALNGAGYGRVQVHVGDGSLGWPESAPYQGIVVTAAAPKAPHPLLNQLDDGGKLVLPVGARGRQELQVWERRGANFTHESIIPVSFVPLRGEYGWSEEQWPLSL
ncbi:MAG: protein-L-isoaspartate(D-aspartate) O-methyltransferase [Anaerolineaceae bacterium]|nr:protein-L-isoaspartate(D-aspartate) O-methyltransferase [Anaerolineaceae bacterium]